ncbi:MAG: CynX/NimT family MFS transporter [Acidimicrobiales bacterium]
MGDPTPAGRRRGSFLLAAGLLLVSLNLRPAMSALSPVLGAIRRTTGLSAAGAGLLTTLPLICFGLLAPLAPRLVRRRGTGAVLLGCLLVLFCGILVRSTGYAGLFVGTLLIGVSVAIANVLMPGIVKRDFPGRVSLMTGLYTAMLSAGAGLAAGTTAPLARALGGNWRLATGAWALPVVVAIAVLVPLRSHARPAGEITLGEVTTTLWKSPVAWAVTLFMGVQSLEFYSTLAWLPTVFHDRGVPVVTAGVLLAVSNCVGIFAALVTPWIAHRVGDVRVAVLGAVALAGLGITGLLTEPHRLDVLWAVLLGSGQGATISLALMVMVLRSSNQHEAMALSGMAQGVGYLIAAVGPTLLGALYDLAHTWSLPLAVLLGLLGFQAIFGYLAALDRPATAEPGTAPEAVAG